MDSSYNCPSCAPGPSAIIHSSYSGSKKKEKGNPAAPLLQTATEIAVEAKKMNPLVVAASVALLIGFIPIIWSAVRISKFSTLSQKLALAALLVTIFVPLLGPVVGLALVIASQVMHTKNR